MHFEGFYETIFLSDKHKGLSIMTDIITENFKFSHGYQYAHLYVSDKVKALVQDPLTAYEHMELFNQEFNGKNWFMSFASNHSDITAISTGFVIYRMTASGISQEFYVFDCDKNGSFEKSLIECKSAIFTAFFKPENFNNPPNLDAIKTANWAFSPSTGELIVSDSFRRDYDPDFIDEFMMSFNAEMSDHAWSFPDAFDLWFVGSIIHGLDTENPLLVYAWDNEGGYESLEERLATYGKANLYLMTLEDEN